MAKSGRELASAAATGPGFRSPGWWLQWDWGERPGDLVGAISKTWQIDSAPHRSAPYSQARWASMKATASCVNVEFRLVLRCTERVPRSTWP